MHVSEHVRVFQENSLCSLNVYFELKNNDFLLNYGQFVILMFKITNLLHYDRSVIL